MNEACEEVKGAMAVVFRAEGERVEKLVKELEPAPGALGGQF